MTVQRLVLLTLLLTAAFVNANPESKPYVAFRTSPFEHSHLHHSLEWDTDNPQSSVRYYDPNTDAKNPQCPLQFSLGVSRRLHTFKRSSIVEPPLIAPILPSKGPGRQVLFTHYYEHLELLTPASSVQLGQLSSDSIIKEGLVQQEEFPMLFESSFFRSSPILADVNGDGVLDAILTDYDGGIYAMGLQVRDGRRYFHRAQVPRLHVRRQWMESRLNETLPPEEQQAAVVEDEDADRGRGEPNDPFHSYFEYTYGGQKIGAGDVLRGVTANVLGQENLDIKGLEERRNRKVGGPEEAVVETDIINDATDHNNGETIESGEQHNSGGENLDAGHRRLQEIQQENQQQNQEQQQQQGNQQQNQEQQHQERQQENQEQQQQNQEQQQRDQVHQQQQQRDREQQQQQEQQRDREQQQQQEQQQQRDREQQHQQEQQQRDREQQQQRDREQQQQEQQQRDREQQQQRDREQQQQEQQQRDREQQQQRDREQQQREQQQRDREQQQQQEQQQRNEAQQQQHDANHNVQEEVRKAAAEQVENLVVDASASGDQALNQQEEKQDTGGQGEPGAVRIDGAPEGTIDNPGHETTHKSGDSILDELEQQRQNAFADHGEDEDYNPLSDAEGGDDIYAGDNNGDGFMGDDDFASRNANPSSGGDDQARYDDEYPRYDDYYGRYDSEHEEYFDEKHYLRLPPHILCTPVLAELPKLYGKDSEKENMLFVAVSYYLDEDEYEGFFSYKRFDEVTDHGDETEVERGMYVANAIMVYQFGDSPRWGRQEHLDLSTDHTSPVNATLVGSFPLMEDVTKMGAFALSSPTIADIDGDGTSEVLFGTSLGFVYVFDARNLFKKENWPVQFKFGIESRILVEDVRGDTNLEIFVADVGGNIVCLDHKGNKIWHRNLAGSVGGKNVNVRASSPMTLGDVDGDGVLDVVVVFKFKIDGKPLAHFVFALSGDDGKDLPTFPIRIWGVDKDAKKEDLSGDDDWLHQKLPMPLLVDLHSDQRYLQDYLRRNGTKWIKPQPTTIDPPPHGGNAMGLHIVQPIDTRLVIIEAGSGCIQSTAVGDEILAMVQADDVHGTGSLDLVVSTASGNIITLESESPFHPLNTWNHGEIRGKTNSFAHGYSASQGIFVHEISRQYRDIFGIYVPVTFEIFDNRPNIQNEPDKRIYNVEIRDGGSAARALFRKQFKSTGVFTERLYIPYGPGYYVLSVVMMTTHGLIYEDTFHLGYNVHYMDGFGILLWLPLLIASICIFLCGSKKTHWEDEDFEGEDDSRNGRQAILGGSLPS
jgi:hypothetical protein